MRVPLRRTRVAAASATIVALAVQLMVLTSAGAAESPRRVTTDRVVRDSRIDEQSGMACSRRFKGVTWAHNDSGPARIYAVGPDGRTKAAVTLSGVRNLDWEDMTVGKGGDLFVGDIGDNAGRRKEIVIHRWPEPRRLANLTVRPTSFRFRFPGGPRDAEAIMVNPRSGVLYVVSKMTSPDRGAIYRAPRGYAASRVNTLVRVATAPNVVTAADFRPGTDRFVLRDYKRAYIYPRMGATPRVVQLPPQRQGESICFAGVGQLLIGSEGIRQPIMRVRF